MPGGAPRAPRFERRHNGRRSYTGRTLGATVQTRFFPGLLGASLDVIVTRSPRIISRIATSSWFLTDLTP